MEKRVFLPLLFLLLCTTSCEMIEYHPYDGRIRGERELNPKNIARIEESCNEKEKLRFAVISDTQGWYDDTEDFVRQMNKRNDVDFVIHTGDLSNYGATKELEWMRDRLAKLNIPIVCLLGNHDCLGNGLEIYHQLFGTENFAFQAGDIRFICLNTNALEFDYSKPIPDFGFLKEELAGSAGRPEQKRTVVAMHARPGTEQFNNNVAEVFQLYLNLFPGLQFCLYGHGHHVRVDDLFGDGILYYECASIHARSYLLFTFKPEGEYSYEAVPF